MKRISSWISPGTACLIAIDAPLGWPRDLGAALVNHRAGSGIPVEGNLLFRRETDRNVKARIGKQPLDIGADRIARTAHAALSLLEMLREATPLPIPLAWDARPLDAAAIEVYPAATLAAHGIRSSGYKRREQLPERREIVEALAGRIEVRSPLEDLQENDDVLDAGVCILAAMDFLLGNASPPVDLELARSEGWIWVRDRVHL